MFIGFVPLKKCPGRNKKLVELRPPTAAVDLQLRPVPCGVPTPRHLQLRPEAAPTPPRWTPNPGASRAPAVAARRAPTSAPPAPAVVAAHLGTCISGQSPPPLRRPITRAQAPAVTCRRRPPGRSIVGPEHGRLRVSKGEIRSRPSPTSSRGTASLTSFPFFPSAVFLIVREMDPVLSCGSVQRVCNCQLTAICSVHTIARMQNYL